MEIHDKWKEYECSCNWYAIKCPKAWTKKEITEAELKDYAVKKYEDRASERENGDDDNNSVVCLLTEFSRSIFGWLHNYTLPDTHWIQ